MKQKCYLDANILTNYVSIAHSQFKAAHKVVVKLIVNRIIPCISPLCIDETLYVIKRNARKRKLKNTNKRVKRALKIILKIPKIEIVNPPTTKSDQRKVLKIMGKYNLDARDAYHLLTAKHNNIQYFETLDKDFNKAFKAGGLKRFL